MTFVPSLDPITNYLNYNLTNRVSIPKYRPADWPLKYDFSEWIGSTVEQVKNSKIIDLVISEVTSKHAPLRNPSVKRSDSEHPPAPITFSCCNITKENVESSFAVTPTSLINRLTRFEDLIKAATALRRLGVLAWILNVIPKTWDYAQAFCLAEPFVDSNADPLFAWLVSTFIHNDHTFTMLKFKAVSNVFKQSAVTYPKIKWICEAETYRPYRNVNETLKDVMDAVAEHTIASTEILTTPTEEQAYIDDIVAKTAPRDFITFEEFIDNGGVDTSGASTAGYLFYTLPHDPKIHKKKAMKNAIPYLKTTEQRKIEAAKIWYQMNQRIRKRERDKDRTVMQSPDDVNEALSWIVRLAGEVDKSIPGVIPSVNPIESVEFDDQFTAECDGSFTASADWKGFDTQMPRRLIKMVIEIFVKVARKTVPLEHSEYFEKLSANLLASFDRSYLTAEWSGEGKTAHIRRQQVDTLTSGLRATNVIANIIGDFISKLVVSDVERVAPQVAHDTSSDRAGDDTAMHTREFWGIMLLLHAYDKRGVRFSPTKTHVKKEAAEMLRKAYFKSETEDKQATEWRKSGYIARKQIYARKPWVSMSHEDFADLKQVKELLTMRVRCGSDPEYAKAYVEAMWSNVHAKWFLNYAAGKVPVDLGGIGLTTWLWDGKTQIRPPVSSVLRKIRIGAQPVGNTERVEQYGRKLAQRLKVGEGYYSPEVVGISNFQNLLTAADAPFVVGRYRRLTREALKRTKFEEVPLLFPYVKWAPLIPPQAHNGFTFSQQYTTYKNSTSYGYFSRIKSQIELFNKLKPGIYVSLKTWLKQAHPRLAQMLSGREHIANLLDWFLGSYGTSFSFVHPSLFSFYTYYYCSSMRGSSPKNIKTAIQIMSAGDDSVFSVSALQRKYFSW